MLRIGLTGGIASGKSTVAAMFAEHGAEVIDTDDIAHELVAPGGAAIDPIAACFGDSVLARDGGLDRRKMRQRVFNDAGDRRKLEAILHPLIRAIALERAAETTAPYVIFVVPLLFETRFNRLVDRSLAVDCPESLQIERVIARDQVNEDEARAIIASQMNRADRRAAADDWIDSSGSLAATRDRVLELHEQFLALSENCPETQGRAE